MKSNPNDFSNFSIEQLIRYVSQTIDEYLSGLHTFDLPQEEWNERYTDGTQTLKHVSEKYSLMIMGQVEEGAFRTWLIKMIRKYSDDSNDT